MTLYEKLSLALQILFILAGVITVVVYFRQLQAMKETAHQSLVMHRRELYQDTVRSLIEDEEHTIMLHPFDHFDLDIYRKRYAGDLRKIHSYLLMKRKYLYLVFTTSYAANENDPAREASTIWLKELCCYQEFRDVHESQGKYYSKFARIVDDELKHQGSVAAKWAVHTLEMATPNNSHKKKR